MNLICRLFLLILTWLPVTLCAQSYKVVSDKTAFQELYTHYKKLHLRQLPFFNGEEYLRLPFTVSDGIPYFKSDRLSPGSIHYRDGVYHDVPLLYDQVKDELVTSDPSGSNLITLKHEFVTAFSFHGSDFISHHYRQIPLPSTGYYELLYQGNSTILKKEKKKINDVIKIDAQAKTTITSQSTYFVQLDKTIQPVKNYKSLVSLLKSSNPDIAGYAKKNKKRFRKMNQDQILTELAQFADRSIKAP